MKDRSRENPKEEKKKKSFSSFISIGMKSPLAPDSSARLDFDAIKYDDNNNNNNDDAFMYSEREDSVFDDDHTNYDDYLRHNNSFPRRKKITSPEIKTPPTSRLPVFKLLQVNRIKAEKVALMGTKHPLQTRRIFSWQLFYVICVVNLLTWRH